MSFNASGSSGFKPVSFSTVSENFDGCAVDIYTTDLFDSFLSLSAAIPIAVCGSSMISYLLKKTFIVFKVSFSLTLDDLK